MRQFSSAVSRLQFTQSLRRAVEYAIAVGAAFLASYVILQGRW